MTFNHCDHQSSHGEREPNRGQARGHTDRRQGEHRPPDPPQQLKVKRTAQGVVPTLTAGMCWVPIRRRNVQ